MKKHMWGVLVACIAPLFLLPHNLSARPRAPLPPFPEVAPLLYRADFDEMYSGRREYGNPVRTPYGDVAESWSGFALIRSGALVSAFAVPAVDGAGRTNVACAEGAVRLWFKPYWSSGLGPGADAHLVELNADSAHWSLAISPDGSTISLVGSSDGTYAELLKAEIAWEAGQWHLLALNYGPKGSALFIDAKLVAEGAGVTAVAPRAAALTIGSTLAGTETAEGEFDEVCASDRSLSAAGIAFYYGFTSPTAARGPITPEEEEAARAGAPGVPMAMNM